MSCLRSTLIKGLIRNFGVRRLGIFGSFVRQQQDVESDVDVLVEFEPGYKTFDTFMQLAFFLEELFERRVELVTPESLSPYIGPHILKEIEYVSFDACLPASYPQGDSVWKTGSPPGANGWQSGVEA